MKNDELRQVLFELEAIEGELSRRKRDNALSYYTPNAIQIKAHNSKANVIAYVGGNRSGKSTYGAVETGYHTTGQYPDWYPEWKKFHGPIKAVVVATEFPVVERVIEPKLKVYLPKDSVLKWKRSPQGYLQRVLVKHITGGTSIIDILTGEMDDMACESADWDFYWGDEPQQKSKYYAIQRGLVDRLGKTVLTFTPLIEPWMKDDLVDKADGKEIEVFTADIRDNLNDIKGQSILSEDSIKRFEAMLPDDVKETRIHGKFFHLKGVVYKEFSDVHIRDFAYEFPNDVVCILDPHDRKPHHVVWAMVNRSGDIYVLYEYTKHCTLRELAANILGVEAHYGFKMRTRLIDPNFGRKPLISIGRSVIEELASLGLYFTEANDCIEAGQLKVKQYLHYDNTKPIDINNCPKMFFHKFNVPKTIHSMRSIQYDDWVGKKDLDPKEKVKDKDTHGADCIRYLAMFSPSYGNSDVREPEYEGVLY